MRATLFSSQKNSKHQIVYGIGLILACIGTEIVILRMCLMGVIFDYRGAGALLSDLFFVVGIAVGLVELLLMEIRQRFGRKT
jgi:hypothetical protein